MFVSLLTLCWLIAIVTTAAGGQVTDCDATAAGTTEAANESCAHETPARPGVSAKQHAGSRFGLAFKTSTLGLGAEFGTRLTNRVNLRVGFSGLNYSRTVSDSGMAYVGSLRLRSVQSVVDWFPWSHGFHLSPGLLLFDGNHVTAKALLPTGQVLTSGENDFVSNPRDPIKGFAQSTMRKVAPIVLFGFGNIVPHTRRFSVATDFGVVFQGMPNTQFVLLGSACDASGVHCRDITRDASIQADVRSGQKTMQDDLSMMKYYPVISVQFGYRF
ncbi:MAG TPA: hypothetical protein VLA83_15175 [Candidatus Binatia bacterium]|nr:hypothetical protein [Candidatus Binatia bacterium]